jgi:threonine dehydratase
MPVFFPDLQEAQRRLGNLTAVTPLLEAPLLNEKLGFRLLVKAECLQVTGSFKARGALNNLLHLSQEKRALGVVAFSSGNHAQGVAYAAKVFNSPATIVMPKNAPALKIANTKAYGAEVLLYNPETQSREELGQKLADERGLTLIKPYDAVNTIAGQGTAGLEIADQCTGAGVIPDHVIVPCSGGGLAAGVTLAMKQLFPRTHMHTAEPEGFDDMRRSLASGHLEKNEKKTGSICDALLANTPGGITFSILKANNVTGYAVSDTEALKAMAVAARFFKLTLEPGGAVALATALFKHDFKEKCVVAVASGGNADAAMVADALIQHSDTIAV